MAMTARGLTKLIEECGELQQILGKKLAYWDTDIHPDGESLRDRMIEEIGDVLAAIYFVVGEWGLDGLVDARVEQKLALFMSWHRMEDNDHGIGASQ